MSSKQESIIHRTVGGAAWTIGTSMGSRLLGVVGTITLTYFIVPKIAGEVSLAYIFVLSAHQIFTWGVPAYVVAKPNAGRDVLWHATVLHLSMGLIPILATWPLGGPVSRFLGAANMTFYIPGFIVAVLLERLGNIPEKVLARELHFRAIGIGRTLSEITYTVLSVTLAALWTKLGGHPDHIGNSIVYGNIARSLVFLIVVSANANRADWLTPAKLHLFKVREIFRFGIPVSIAALSNFTARRLDNFVIAKLFGPAVVGAYDRAYNLADIPAVQIGEQIGDVLLPSFAQMTEEDRKRELVRATGLLSVIVFPLAVGLGVISKTLVDAILPPTWWQVAPLLTILAALAVVRPVGWVLMSYLQAADRPKTVMIIGIIKVFLLIGVVAGLGMINEYWACAGVGIGFGFHAVSGMWVVRRKDKIPMTAFFKETLPPLLATVPMAAAVFGTRWAWHHAGLNSAIIGLFLELIAGAVVYIPSALLLARRSSKDLIELVKAQIRRRRGRDSDQPVSSSNGSA